MQNSYSLRFLSESDDLVIDKDLLDETCSWNDFFFRLQYLNLKLISLPRFMIY